MKRAVEEILKFNEERDWDQFHNLLITKLIGNTVFKLNCTHN